MNKIRHAIQFNQGDPLYMQIAWISILELVLTQKTKDYVEHGSLNLLILAAVIKDTMSECKSNDEIDGVLWNKLHDQDLIIGLKSKYKIR